MARKWVVLFRGVKSFLRPFLRPFILAVVVFGLIVSLGEKSPLLANQFPETLLANQFPETLLANQFPETLLANQFPETLLANQFPEETAKAAELIQKGKSLLEIGQPESALEMWQEAEKIYGKIGNYEGIVGSKLNQGQALEEIGFTRESCDIILAAFPGLKVDKCDRLNEGNINDVIKVIISQPSPLNWMGLESLGKRLRFLGKLKESERVLDWSLTLNNSPEAQSKLLLALGNTKLKLGHKKDALILYEMAANTDNALLETRLQALLNKLSVLIEEKDWKNAEFWSAEISRLVANLPVSQFSIEAKINLAGSLLNLEEKYWGVAIGYLEEALVEAEAIENKRLQSLVLGKLGNFYEKNGDREKAKDYTKKALKLAQLIEASEQTYQWQWQWGRLLETEGDLEGAIAAYTASVNTLQTLRGSLTILNRDLQFNFQEQVEPVYRKLVELLLKNPADEKNLILARDAIELLQLAELDNFFKEACARVQSENIDDIIKETDKRTAVIYGILLSNSLEAIVSLPDGSFYHYRQDISPQSRFQGSFKIWRRLLEDDNDPEMVRPNSQKLYDLLIKPAEEVLEKNQVKTLVFVLDNELKNIPMSALYDGEKYLIEKYEIVLVPGLQLIEPSKTEALKIKILAAGRSKFKGEQPFPEYNDLPNIKTELKEVSKDGPNETLLNKDFTSDNFQAEINTLSFSVVHIATHGQFSSKAEETFIVDWKDRIGVNKLHDLLRVKDPTRLRDIELLVLSACQTAEGDRRAALGLAGVAVRAGTRSTIASLWNVEDKSTAELMSAFYNELKNSRVSKAEALRRAQLQLLNGEKYSNPHFWAPFILVGNWL